MRAGKLREQITFQRATGLKDKAGNVGQAWVDHLTCWADVLEMLGRENVQAGRLEAPRTATVRVRDFPESREITAADRIFMRDDIWNIRSAMRGGNKNEWLEFLAEVEVAA